MDITVKTQDEAAVIQAQKASNSSAEKRYKAYAEELYQKIMKGVNK